MSIQERYHVYTPVGGKWHFLFSASTVNKRGGAVEQLEGVVKTGPDARVAIIIDTEKNRHVSMFRMNINNQTQIKSPAGGWKDGDGGVLENTIEADIAKIADHVNAQLEQEPEPEDVIDTDGEGMEDDDIPEPSDDDQEDDATYEYEGQPDYVVLNWQTGAYSIEQYIIPRPTEKQLKALNIAHGCLIGAENTRKQEAALMRINAAVCKKPEYCEGMVKQDKRIKPWVCLWKDHIYPDKSPLRFEGYIVEFAYCGFIE